MATLNERLRDLAIARQIDLSAFSEAEIERLLVILSGADNDIIARLSRVRDPGNITAARLVTLRRSLRRAIDRAHSAVQTDLTSSLGALAANARDEEAEALGRGLISVDIEAVTPRIAATMAAIRATPMDGVLMADWFRRIRRNDFERTWATVLRGVTVGQTTDEMIRAVVGSRPLFPRDGVREVSRRGLTALVRTSITHASTVAREEVWEANKNLLKGVQWVSTLDGRTTPICQSLDGKIFPVGEGPRPPIHMQCRSVMAAILKGWRALGLSGLDESTRASLNGQVPASLNYGEWLGGRSTAFQNQVLGPARAKAFRSGVSLDRFVNDRGRRLTLAELHQRLPSQFAEVGM